MKKVAIDLRSLETPTGKRGIGYFNKRLYQVLLSKPHPELEFDLFTFRKVPALFWPKKGLRRLDFIFAMFWRFILKKEKYDLVHILSLFEIYFLEVPVDTKSIVTIYDIIPLLFPDKYFTNRKAEDWYRQRLDQAKRATRIITISQSSKKDIVKFLKIPPEKITVIYGGVDESFKILSKEIVSKTLKKYKISNPYLLTVSTHSFHKNISRTFESFREYTKKTNQDLVLVVVCKLIDQEKKDWEKEINKLGLKGKVILTNFVSDQDLPAIYNGAEIFLFPSLYEGLGLPVLESFACGVPVITSNTSSLPEVSGQAAILISPESTQELVIAISNLLSDDKLRQDLIRNGFEQVKKFSWNKAADQTLKVYKEVLSES